MLTLILLFIDTNIIVIVHTTYFPNIMNVRIMISIKGGQNTHQQIIAEHSE